jgi:MFS family permease
MSPQEVTLTGTIYLVGEILGALVFGRLTDTIGRKKLFVLTLAIYLFGSGVAGLSFSIWFLYVFRFIAGMGIGGEYTAINSAIDELIPARYRGRVDLTVNGTYWLGAGLGAVANLFLLNKSLVPTFWGWRIAFFVGPVMGLVIIMIRRHIPESPRWMLTHGHADAAHHIVDGIEAQVQATGHKLKDVSPDRAMSIKGEERIPVRTMLRVFVKIYPTRTVLGLAMMITQSFLYNAIFFSYALVLENFYGVSNHGVSYYFFPFAAGTLLGPIVLGPLFDTVGRRKMIVTTYGISAIVLFISAFFFRAGQLSALTQTIFWCVAFFFASAGASSAYLTVSEIFPLEVRGQAISYFFCIAQGAGAGAAALYGALVGTGTDRVPLFWGYILGAVVMAIGAVVAIFCGVDAEGKGLEDIADPLTRVREDDSGSGSTTPVPATG